MLDLSMKTPFSTQHMSSSAVGSATAISPRRSELLNKATSSAKDFEAILLGQWLQGAEDSFGSVPGDSTDDEAGEDQLRSFGVQMLARSMGQTSCLGISNMVSKALTHAQGSEPHTQTSGTVSR